MGDRIELMKITVALAIVAIGALVAWRTMKKIVAVQHLPRKAPPARNDAIRCAFCGRTIQPDEGVCTHAEGGARPEWTTRERNGRPLGCLRTDCCPSGGYFLGYWTGSDVDYAFEGRTGMEHALYTGNAIIVNDMSKRKR
jgi:hypothetical protein